MFTAKKFVGLDIADRSIEVVELVKKNGKIRLSKVGRIVLAPGVVEGGRIKDAEKLRSGIREVFLQAKPRSIVPQNIYFGLPESQTYTSIVSLENKETSDDGLDRLIHDEAFKNIPLAPEEAVIGHAVRKHGENGTQILVVAVMRDVLDEWDSFFQSIKLHINGYESEVTAISRSLFQLRQSEPECIVDIGAQMSNIAIVDEHGLVYVHTIRFGGNILTSELAGAMEMTLEEAEAQKREYGLENPNQRVKDALISAMSPIAVAVSDALSYAEKRFYKKAQSVILVGGTSRLKGVREYLNTIIGAEAVRGRSKIMDDENFPRLQEHLYIEAVGLALRGFTTSGGDGDDPIIMTETKGHAHRINLFHKDDDRGGKVQDPIDEKYANKSWSSVVFFALIWAFTVLCGALFFLWYKAKLKDSVRANEPVQSSALVNGQKQALLLRVPVAVDDSEYTQDRIQGRVVEDTVFNAESYEAALLQSRGVAETRLVAGEKLWNQPLTPAQKGFPMVFQWLAYSDKDTRRLFLNEALKINARNISFEIIDIVPSEIEQTENRSIIYLKAAIIVNVDEFIE